MTKTKFAMVNNILFSFNKPVKIPLQHIDMKQNRERLLQKFSTAEKSKGFRRRERSEVGKDC